MFLVGRLQIESVPSPAPVYPFNSYRLRHRYRYFFFEKKHVMFCGSKKKLYICTQKNAKT